MNWLLALLLACLLAIGLWYLLGEVLLRVRSAEITGHILDRRESRTPRGWTTYTIRYDYTFRGKTYAHTQRVDADTYHIWSEGDTAPVHCFPPLPIIARLDLYGNP
jgi:hypothetical protein